MTAVSQTQRRPAASAPAGLIWHGPADIPADWGPCVVTIGVFDGVHRGHTRLIEQTVARARQLHVPAVMITFDPHPATITGPPRDTSTLSCPARRAVLAHRHGIDAVLVLSFTPRLAQMTAPDFVQHILVDALRARAVVVGDGFTFGANGRGRLDVLRDLGRRHGFTAETVDLLHDDANTRFSSTDIRRCISMGDLAAARRALGRPHRIGGQLDGKVLSIPPDTAVPPPGRYQVVVIGPTSVGPLVYANVESSRRIITLDHPPSIPGHGAIELDFLSLAPVVGDPRSAVSHSRPSAGRSPRPFVGRG